ncbi:hypothetical protein TcWFU_007767 [Taenia crassiceps]|uniref:T-box domain-containing protein n=1 Tax=Taenia crassiceps TaxID=6207 RepID=A0ABR4QT41_9CEST
MITSPFFMGGWKEKGISTADKSFPAPESGLREQSCNVEKARGNTNNRFLTNRSSAEVTTSATCAMCTAVMIEEAATDEGHFVVPHAQVTTGTTYLTIITSGTLVHHIHPPCPPIVATGKKVVLWIDVDLSSKSPPSCKTSKPIPCPPASTTEVQRILALCKREVSETSLVLLGQLACKAVIAGYEATRLRDYRVVSVRVQSPPPREVPTDANIARRGSIWLLIVLLCVIAKVEFVTVTAYQDRRITELKVGTNAHAAGFRYQPNSLGSPALAYANDVAFNTVAGLQG